VIFFDELVDSFYKKLGPGHTDPSNFCLGQVLFAAVPYSDEQKQYWRPVGYDKLTTTSATQFNIVGGGTDLFRRALPLHTPKLEVSEEFLVVRAKRRPVVLVARPGVGVLGRLSKHHLVIPRYGAVKGSSDQPKLSEDVVNRVRSLEYPELFFSPAEAPTLSKDGFFATHLLQPIPLSRLEATPLCLGDQAVTVLTGQVLHHCFGTYEGGYADWREMLLNPGKST
jgi:hypothetical protein